MTWPEVQPSDIWVVAVYVLILWVPGLLLGKALGARGWVLFGTSPLITYSIVGLAGPAYSAAGLNWSTMSFGVTVGIIAVVAGTVSIVSARSPASTGRRIAAVPPPSEWSQAASIAVAAVASSAAVVGAAAILTGIRTFSAIPQDWDAVFHANGIREIATTGNGGLFAMGQVNWYEDGIAVFYPNAYHLLATIAYQLTGSTLPVVLNAHTVLIPGLLAFSLVTLVRRLGGRAVLAGFSAVVAVSISALYDLLWRGPLLPFATGLALTPLIVVLLLELVDAPRWRGMARPGVLLSIGLAGLLCLHPAIMIGGALFAAPAMIQRWWQQPSSARTDLPVTLLSGLIGAVFCVLQLAGAASSASNLSAIDWPADLSQNEAIGELLTFSHAGPFPQWWIVAAVLAGLLGYRRLAQLRWLGIVAVGFGSLFVIAASSDEPWANSITSFWWNDRWRLIALAAVPLCVIAGHGLAEIQRVAWDGLCTIWSKMRSARNRDRSAVGSAVVAVAVVIAFALLSNDLYFARNAARMAQNVGDGPAISGEEVAGIRALADIVPAGSRVLNDRGDGSAWMYALAGVRPVAGHYDGFRTGPDAAILARQFKDYPTNPEVQAAVQRLNIEYVMLGKGFLRPDTQRAPGLTDLSGANWLTRVYINDDVVIYRIDDADLDAGRQREGEPVASG
ncbi:DUF6541 family protein [Pseudonocardia bannensis]|uniref:Copper-transporting ATPase n=1 Tax=Pseudonocardia bannensis TaxID=630973 RepID=A0A848DAX1_9PSEU|nr:DUF6541 family protein [Pseudonocardia bannensis]NMH90134.1 hypothetical protein [Pseudonocardia bannensis]